METSFVHEQEEETRRAAAASQAKQGQCMSWHDVRTRKISWRGLWVLDANCIKVMVGATYDVLRTPNCKFSNHLHVCLRINKLRFTLCQLMIGTVEFILCERGRKVDTRHAQKGNSKWGKVQD